MYKVLIALLGFYSLPTLLAADRYDFLKRYDRPVLNWVPEHNPSLPAGPPVVINQKMTNYYSAFAEDGVVNIYLGFGKDAYNTARVQEVFNKLQSLAATTPQAFDQWNLVSGRTIRFRDVKSGLIFLVSIGHERNEFVRSLATHEIVMYHGHSRYGRGPAFDDYSNYFRMGNQFEFIEVDTRNKYFLTEPIQQSQIYPPLSIQFGSQSFLYQYMGQKVDSSYLPNTSYTKIIPGYAADLDQTEFLEGKQIVWLYSCENIHYFKDPLRALYSDPNEKLFFGTLKPGFWSSSPAAVFVMSIAKRVQQSQQIVAELDATNDCGPQCFTVY